MSNLEINKKNFSTGFIHRNMKLGDDVKKCGLCIKTSPKSNTKPR